MQTADLTHLLDAVAPLRVNRYSEPVARSIHDNWMKSAGEHHLRHSIVRDDRGFPSITLFGPDEHEVATIRPARLPTCAETAANICSDKLRTARVLERSGIRAARARVYQADQVFAARSQAFRHTDKVAVKAATLSLARGVFLNVTRNNFARIFRACLEAQQPRSNPQVLVQDMLDGFEVRVVVVEGAVHHVVARIPAYVRGRAGLTIDELIVEKNEQRSADAVFSKKHIRRGPNLSAQLQQEGLSEESVPADGEPVLLSSVSNTTKGGETAVVTDLTSRAIKDLALRATAAIPGLRTAGVDVMVTSLDDQDPTILEVNAFPHMQLGMYPMYGEPTDPLAAYLDALWAQDRMRRGALGELSVTEFAALGRYTAFLELKDDLATTRAARG